MKKSLHRAALALTLVVWSLAFSGTSSPRVRGWLNWRGPLFTGVSLERGLPDTVQVGGGNNLWTYKLSGRGTPVIANGKLYAWGYEGTGPDLQEIIVCLDAETGKKIWEHRYNDFLSDIVYDRYAIGSPTVDAETGNVYVTFSSGNFACFSADGKVLWWHWMMEEFGRLTFVNGRTGGPLIEDDLVIIRGVTSNWGSEGPAADRFYAFDKKTGQLVWSSTPGLQPKDNSFAQPAMAWRDGKRVFYTGEGSGNIVCVNARTGQPIWRYPVSAGGFNASVVLHKNKVIGIHNDENLEFPQIGGMVAVNLDATPKPVADGSVPVLDKSAEVWRNELRSISSSPVIVGDLIYQVDFTGNLNCVDANTGKILWDYKLAPDQLHASPTYADGKLYVPMQNGTFYILRPSASGVEELCKVQLEGLCYGAPAIWNGKIYVLTTEKLYCFGRKGNNGRAGVPASPDVPEPPRPKPGPTVALQIIPAEVLLHPGEKVRFTIRGIDANGFPTQTFDPAKAKWERYIPPTARVRAGMEAHFNERGELVADKPSAGAFQATIDGFTGIVRGRILPHLPIYEDFESFTLDVPHETEPGVKFAYPPLAWIGARFKFEVRELDGNKVLAKTLDNIFFQRATVFIGNARMKDYTIEADVRTDGNRRNLSTVGLSNQHYLIALQGNAQTLEVSSNQERIKEYVPFTIQPGVWYRLKARVDVNPDGSGVVRAKAWKKGDPEPEKWTIEVPHKHAHQNGSPGLYGFSPQSQFRVYIDNLAVTPNRP
ncbi:MAG: PQQ-like beta-propeller repeat protein [Abditibacteriales bacterium]|nr:PQQ-like beta-propeller repeat protein [Abditibacteriales bacterium]MDW8367062.1 PQQ-binding-like beta-propeller repeat protein [Abditibacteriales bacterium]